MRRGRKEKGKKQKALRISGGEYVHRRVGEHRFAHVLPRGVVRTATAFTFANSFAVVDV